MYIQTSLKTKIKRLCTHYVGKGIEVCDDWKVFEVFRYWAITHGYNETLTIDRIDNEKGYNPENCRWVTPAQQNRNQTSNIRVKMGTGDLILKDWCRLLGFSYSSVRRDIYSGMTPEQALRKTI